MSKNEKFNFEDSAYAMVSQIGETDGTVNRQQIEGATYQPLQVPNGVIPGSMYCEPERNIVLNGGFTLDSFSRMIIVSHRLAGTGTWAGELEFIRASLAGTTLVPWTIPLRGSISVAIIDNPFAADFMRTQTGATIADVCRCRSWVTPGSTDITSISVSVFLAPGFVSGVSNKGAIVSGPEYIVN